MANEIFMPKLSSTMEEGVILDWFKEEGDEIETGEPIFEIMTDKINIEVESYHDGILLKKYFHKDDTVPVNHVIGFIGEQGEEVPDTPPASDEESSADESSSPEQETAAPAQEPETEVSTEKVRATPAARAAAREKNVSLHNVSGSGPKGRIHKADVLSSGSQGKSTPLAEKMASHHGIDTKNVEGTGAGGKVMKNDINALLAESSENRPENVTESLRGVRKVTAERMADSSSTIPHVTMDFEVDMEQVIRLREALKSSVEKATGQKLSYNEIFVLAVSKALQRHPDINITYDKETITYHNEVNVGVAVAVEENLYVPVLKNTERKSLSMLADELKPLIFNTREGRIDSASMQGGTFTISNLGMFAIDSFTPIINKPQGAILGISRMKEVPVVKEGEVKVSSVTTFSLSFDHRVINGAPAAAFCTTLKNLLEEPYELLV
ncbi:dihydrolipoamide acetyltransferase family protein [Salimicrobium halophilum]|uniref:Dihydrolipoamide acetyltransferase component of pyruvate dehydrogenase complex n=1 Tax=Salimicrobium halophilum TaxID=86666 RepID=A0A1G8URV0_9BACI|nr:dihydrolipoamide acetyltransferase family protein [Salimicrobium halophilum]SDJ56521.1 pyruvate dehydrogenase E2 component (dihydrolipoamide acetyltransferase) [Salimicrobium halophilum]